MQEGKGDGLKIRYSVIIPSKSEAAFVKECIASVRASRRSDVEIIVVDSGNDATMKTAKRMGARVFWQKPKGPGAARNLGAAKARGDVFVFLDADSHLPENFFSVLERSINGIGGGVFPLRPYDNEDVKGILTYSIASGVAKFFISMGCPMTIGSCFFYKREVFEKAGGFNEGLITNEDHELASKAHRFGRFVFIEDAVVEVSMRRLKQWGLLKSIMIYFASTLVFILGKGTLRWYFDA